MLPKLHFMTLHDTLNVTAFMCHIHEVCPLFMSGLQLCCRRHLMYFRDVFLLMRTNKLTIL